MVKQSPQLLDADRFMKLFIKSAKTLNAGRKLGRPRKNLNVNLELNNFINSAKTLHKQIVRPSDLINKQSLFSQSYLASAKREFHEFSNKKL